MASKILYFAIVCVLVGYYVYIPLPENTEEPWKVMFLHATMGTVGRLAEVIELLGLNSYMSTMSAMMSSNNVPPISDENVTVSDTVFNNVPVRLFVPKKSSITPRRALLYFHGGGWCIGSPAMKPYDLLARWTAGRLNVVVVSVDYRLAPAHHFPIPFEDVYAVSKYFLQKKVLDQFNVDPNRVGISGDSAGGNLAAAVTQQAELSDVLGMTPYMEVMRMGSSLVNVPAMSDENVTVTDTVFNGVPVRLFVPVKSSNTPRRAVIFFHGGGWCILSPAAEQYDLLSRWTSNRLNAVVVSVDYRLAPEHHFPAAFEDVYAVTKYFLQMEILDQYNVDPGRICVSGDSAGGNLAAAVTQQLQEDPDVKVKPKIQALIYPALQSVDLDTPSYLNKMPFLSKRDAAWFWTEYLASDGALFEAMMSNTHVTSEDNHLIKFANWSNLLPEELKKDHMYSSPRPGRSEFVKKYPGIVDPRASPLLVEDAKLSKLPLTYIISCMYDPLRDDAFMYVTRLKQVGVQVIHDHYDNAFHGMQSMITGQTELSLGHRMVNDYISRLNENM